jgi:hydrogenase maturation protease
MRTLIIGYGEAGSGDASAGLLVSARLRELGLATVDLGGTAMSLSDHWRGYDRVIIVGVASCGREPGELLSWDALNERVPRCAFPKNSFGIPDAIELARMLDLLPPEIAVHAIEGACFDAGSEPSAAVLEAAERLSAAIAAEVSACTSPQ